MEATPSEGTDVLVWGDLVLDLPAHQAWAGRSPIHLSHLQFVILATLMRQPGRVVSAHQVAAGASSLAPRNVRGAVSRLRSRLGEDARLPRIEAVRGIGYRLVAPDHATPT